MNRRMYKVIGKPVAWARPSQTVNGIRYDSQKDEKKDYGFQLLRCHRGGLIDRPMIVMLTFFVEIPKSSKKIEPLDYRTVRPDLSNLIKFIEDAANGVIWKDDSLIVELQAKKVYDFNPRTEMIIIEVDNESRK